MRILRLTGSTPRIWGIDLHPRLTIVHGLDPEVAGPVRAAIDAIVRARISGPELAAAGLGGTVLVGEDEIPLEDVAERAGRLVPAQPLVGADLIAPDAALAAGRQRALEASVGEARAALADAEAALAVARRDWDDARAARRARLDQGRRAREDAVGALRSARARAVEAAASAATPELGPRPTPEAGSTELARLTAIRLEAARAARDAAAAAVAEAEEIRDRHRAALGSSYDLDALRAELADLDAQLAGSASPSASPVLSEADRRALAERRAQILAELAALAPQPTDRVAAALEASETHGGIAAVEAARVAVEWERVRDLVSEADAAPPPPPAAPASMGPVNGNAVAPSLADAEARLRAAQERLTAARRALAEASGAAPLDPAEIEALEAAHAEVLAAWEGSERRIGLGKARRRLEEAQLAEREILARMGFASYTEFMVSGRASGLPSQLDTEEARRELVAAEGSLAEAEAAAAAARAAAAPPQPSPPQADGWDAHAARGRLVETLAALRARAADLLGEDPGDDVATALRERIAADPLPDLRLALDEAGVPLGEILTREEVQVRARAWVARQADAGRKAEALSAERAEIEHTLAQLDAQEGARAAQEALRRRRDEIRDALARAEEDLAAGSGADERLAHDLAELDRAEAELAEAEADRARVEAAATPSTVAPPVDVDLTQLEAEARDAQTAIDVAVSHLLPVGGRDGTDPDVEVDRALGRAEARVAVARVELASLERIQAQRARGEQQTSTIDADAAAWLILARMASQREASLEGGPGPAPLLVDEPFAGVAAPDVARVLEAVAGPASAVQVVVLTGSPDALTWARAADPDDVGVVTAAAAAGYAAR